MAIIEKMLLSEAKSRFGSLKVSKLIDKEGNPFINKFGEEVPCIKLGALHKAFFSKALLEEGITTASEVKKNFNSLMIIESFDEQYGKSFMVCRIADESNEFDEEL